MSDPKKVELASPEWYELATKILAEVAREWIIEFHNRLAPYTA